MVVKCQLKTDLFITFLSDIILFTINPALVILIITFRRSSYKYCPVILATGTNDTTSLFLDFIDKIIKTWILGLFLSNCRQLQIVDLIGRINMVLCEFHKGTY